MKVLALDPGEKVGWARVEMTDRGKWTSDMTHGITPLKDMALRVAAVYGKYDVVIMESWRLAASHAKYFIGSDFPTVQFIGMVRLLAWQNPKTKLVMQAPAIKKTAIKTMGPINPTLHKMVTTARNHDDAHDMDAIMHLHHYSWSLM